MGRIKQLTFLIYEISLELGELSFSQKFSPDKNWLYF